MKAHEIRDRLEKGMRVSVILKVANGVVKRREAVIIDVHRAAASVRFENEVNPRTIRFNEIEIPEAWDEPLPSSIAKPCPFCGGGAIGMSTIIYWVRCADCGAESAHGGTRSAALAKWTRRSNSTELFRVVPRDRKRIEIASSYAEIIVDGRATFVRVHDPITPDVERRLLDFMTSIMGPTVVLHHSVDVVELQPIESESTR